MMCRPTRIEAGSRSLTRLQIEGMKCVNMTVDFSTRSMFTSALRDRDSAKNIP